MTWLARWWFAPVPPERLAALRIAIGAFAVIWTAGRLPEVLSVAGLPATEFAPVGVIRVLGAPLPVIAVATVAVTTLGLLIALTAGIGYRVTAPLAALGLLWTLSYRSAWGMVFHTDNLLVLHVIALAVAPADHAWTLRRAAAVPEIPAETERSPEQRGKPEAPDQRSEGSAASDVRRGRMKYSRLAAGYGWAIKLLAAITCAAYLLAGIAKLRLAGLSWIDGAQLGNQIAVDNLRKALLGARIAPLARILVAHPECLVVFSVLTLAIELGAPLALLGGRVARVWVWGAWGFHLGIVLAMNVWFPYPLAGVAFLPLVNAERLAMWPVRWWRSRGMRAAPGR